MYRRKYTYMYMHMFMYDETVLAVHFLYGHKKPIYPTADKGILIPEQS